jgi:asparagine synthase (glutamine-hydrolysing)
MDPPQKQRLLLPELRRGGPDLAPVRISDELLASCRDSLQRRLAFDFTGRLAEGILYITDRVSMAHSLEVRVPFLDKNVIEFALALPSQWKVHRGKEKRVLAEIARRRLPPVIAGRRKHGLGYPTGGRFAQPLLAFAREVLLEAGRDGPFDRTAIEDLLGSCKPSATRRVRRVAQALMLQLWWNEFIS